MDKRRRPAFEDRDPVPLRHGNSLISSSRLLELRTQSQPVSPPTTSPPPATTSTPSPMAGKTSSRFIAYTRVPLTVSIPVLQTNPSPTSSVPCITSPTSPRPIGTARSISSMFNVRPDSPTWPTPLSTSSSGSSILVETPLLEECQTPAPPRPLRSGRTTAPSSQSP